jgi:hypothetical protein
MELPMIFLFRERPLGRPAQSLWTTSQKAYLQVQSSE